MSPVEIVPVLGGLLLGALLGWMDPTSRKAIGLLTALALSVLATLSSGEYRASWGFLLMDAMLVVVGAIVGLVALHRLRWSRG